MCRGKTKTKKTNKTEYGSHYPMDLPSKQTHLQPFTANHFQIRQKSAFLLDASSSQTNPRVPSTDQQLAFSEQTKINLPSGDLSSCDDCGILFENTHDLQRLLRHWCPENFFLKGNGVIGMTEINFLLKRLLISSEEKEEEKENKEHEVFKYFMKRAKEQNKKQWDQNAINI